jgi:hypothetical protein
MKQGMSLTALAQEVERITKDKRDFIVPTERMVMAEQDGRHHLMYPGGEDTSGRYPTIGQYAHRQIGDRTGIPAKYYDKMRSMAPNLLAENVNHWFTEQPEKRMVRTLDGTVRAFLSDRYRIIDNYDIAEIALRAFQSVGDMVMASCAVTEQKMYLKARFPSIQREVRKGDIVESGIILSNSEVGLGALSVMPFITTLVCTNGMVMNDSGIRKAHLGAQQGDGDNVVHLLTDETISADNTALMLKVRDVVGALSSPENFHKIVDRLRDAAERPIEGDVRETVEVLATRFRMTDLETGGVLKHLIQGHDLSQYGLANAVTRMSADIDSYDRATELEEVGGKIIDLKPAEWRQFAEAA